MPQRNPEILGNHLAAGGRQETLSSLSRWDKLPVSSFLVALASPYWLAAEEPHHRRLLGMLPQLFLRAKLLLPRVAESVELPWQPAVNTKQLIYITGFFFLF